VSLFCSNEQDDNEYVLIPEKTSTGQYYGAIYGKPPVQEAMRIVQEAAQKHGINGHAAAMRWTAFHSHLDGKHGDAVIFGMSKIEQLHKTIDALEAGPLHTDLAEAISAIYSTVEGSEPSYHL
jgi:aflatoxin B1 aldehyde reductase